MPYASLDSLPVSVRRRLPPLARKVYLGAFNGAWRWYAVPSRRRGPARRRVYAVRLLEASDACRGFLKRSLPECN